MHSLICPVCRQALTKENRTYKCCNNHCFDIAKQGYVNLLQSQQSKLKRHGDDKLMINSRTEFLNKGYYEPLQKELCVLLNKYLQEKPVIVDAGCGDCYYTAEIEKSLSAKQPEIIGIDISKDAVISASKRSKTIDLVVAGVFSMPVGDEVCDAVLNVFSPFAPQEYSRVLKDNGVLVRVIPLENHLYELKASVYDTPYKNPAEDTNIDGFELLENSQLKYTIELDSNKDIESLFKMTPYYYKTSQKDQLKLKELNYLKVGCEFAVLVYKKVSS